MYTSASPFLMDWDNTTTSDTKELPAFYSNMTTTSISIMAAEGETTIAPVTKTVPPRRHVFVDLDYRTAWSILWTLSLVVQPIITIFGVFGNISSMVVLAHQGLHKSSNILLMSLAVGDILNLLGINNVLATYHNFFRKKTRLTHDQSLAVYVIYTIQNLCMGLGYNMSIWFSVLITLERLIAVYLPLKFNSIIRASRTRIAVIVVTVVVVFKASWGLFRTSFLYNASKGYPIVKNSAIYLSNRATFTMINEVSNYLNGFIPVATVCAGSILIGIRVSVAARKRRKMLSASAGEKPGQVIPRSNRTTVTLLCVCILFTCTLGLGFCMESFLPYQPTWIYYIVRHKLTYILYTLNSSGNFVIYVVTNKNFRDTYLSIFVPWMKTTSTESKLTRASSGFN